MKTDTRPKTPHVAAALLLLCCLGCKGLNRGPQGYLAADKNGAIFLQFTEQRGQLSGQLQAFGVEGRGAKRTDSKNAAFTGSRDDSDNVSLRFAVFFTDRTVTGTLSGDKLSLVLPQSNGTLATVEFRKASVSEYNSEIEKIKKQVAEFNSDAARAQADRFHAEQVSRRAAEVSENIRRAYESLTENINSLSSVLRFDKPLTGFSKHWREMQEHEKAFKDKAAVRPLDDNRLRELGYALQGLSYDQQHISYDRQNLEYVIENAKREISETREAIATLKSAWEEFQSARNTEARDHIRSEIDESQIADITGRAEAAVRSAESAVGEADSKARMIERQVAEVYKRSESLLDRLSAKDEDK
jgi:chromosome segregation ATPase